MNYRHLKCYEESKHVDDLINQFSKERDLIITTIPKFKDGNCNVGKIWGQNGVLMVDKSCICNMGVNNIYGNAKCTHCKLIGTLNDYQNESFVIETGKHAGKTLTIREQKLNQDLGVKCTNGRVYFDRFTNSLIQQWVLELISIAINKTNYNRCYTGFVCGDKGFMMTDITYDLDQKLSSLNPRILDAKTGLLTPEVVDGIITQVALFYSHLKYFQYDHGSQAKVAFENKVFSYNYDGISVACPITFVLTDLSRGSIKLTQKMENKKEESTIFVPLDTKEDLITRSDGFKSLAVIGADGKQSIKYFWFIGGTPERLNNITYFDGYYNECVPAFNFYRAIIQLLNNDLFSKSLSQSDKVSDIIEMITEGINQNTGVLKMNVNIIDLVLSRIKTG